MYPYNTASRFSVPSGDVVGLYSSTKYSFADCINRCDEWNEENPDAEAACLAVSYYANLTNTFEEHAEW